MQQQGKKTEDLCEADWIWGAAVFDAKGGFMQYGTAFAARIHSIDIDLIRRMLTTFGGSVGTVAGTLQWRLSSAPLSRFLNGVRPLLKDPELCQVVDRALLRVGEIRRKRGTAALEPGRFEAFVAETRTIVTELPPPPTPIDPAMVCSVPPCTLHGRGRFKCNKHLDAAGHGERCSMRRSSASGPYYPCDCAVEGLAESAVVEELPLSPEALAVLEADKPEPPPRAKPGPKPAPPPPVVVVREPEEEAFGRVPVGPWDEDQVLFEMVQDTTLFPDGMLLEAEDDEQAAEFASAARKLSNLRVVQDEQWVRIWRA